MKENFGYYLVCCTSNDTLLILNPKASFDHQIVPVVVVILSRDNLMRMLAIIVLA